jgi:hypothetical protein
MATTMMKGGAGVAEIALGTLMGGLGVSIVTGALSAIKTGYDAVVDKIKQSIDQLRNYSGQVSGALAQAEIRRINVQLERDRVVGKEIAEFVDLQSRMETSIEKIYTGLMSAFAPVVNDIYAVLSGILDLLEQILKPMFEYVKNFYNDFKTGLAALSFYFQSAPFLPEELRDLLKRLNKWLRDQNSSKVSEFDLATQLKDFLRTQSNQFPPRQNAPQRNLNGQPVFF